MTVKDELTAKLGFVAPSAHLFIRRLLAKGGIATSTELSKELGVTLKGLGPILKSIRKRKVGGEPMVLSTRMPVDGRYITVFAINPELKEHIEKFYEEMGERLYQIVGFNPQ